MALTSVEQKRTSDLGPGTILLELSEQCREVLQTIWLILWPDNVEAYVVND